MEWKYQLMWSVSSAHQYQKAIKTQNCSSRIHKLYPLCGDSWIRVIWYIVNNLFDFGFFPLQFCWNISARNGGEPLSALNCSTHRVLLWPNLTSISAIINHTDCARKWFILPFDYKAIMCHENIFSANRSETGEITKISSYSKWDFHLRNVFPVEFPASIQTMCCFFYYFSFVVELWRWK